MNQQQTPLFQALQRHISHRYAGFHFPAHSGGKIFPRTFVDNLVDFDLTELPGLDDLAAPTGPIGEAQDLAAALYGVDHTHFLVNGTTGGLQALLLALTAPGQKVLLPRNIHRAVLSGLVLSGADPVYVSLPYAPEWGMYLPPKTADVKAVLADNPEVKVALWTHPSYQGQSMLKPEFVRLLQAHRVRILVDEAHGAHLLFNKNLPPSAVSMGAEAVVQSVHKLGGAFTQASWLHLQRMEKSLVQKVIRALTSLQSSSPSYLLMASLDLARQQLAAKGETLLQRALDHAFEFRRELESLPGVVVWSGRGTIQDATKVVVSVRGLGLSGFEAAAYLRQAGRVQLELVGEEHLLFVFGLGVSATDVSAALSAFRALAQKGRVFGDRSCTRDKVFQPPPLPRIVMTPRESWWAASREVSLERACGEVAAETVSICPPGIPVLFPGEQITPEVLEYIQHSKRQGRSFQAGDPFLNRIFVNCE